MFGWKKKEPETEPGWEPESIRSADEAPTWADGSVGPENTASRVYGRLRHEQDQEARLSSAA